MEELLRKLNIPVSTDPVTLKVLLEDKQAEYLDRLDHATDETRKHQLEETLKEIETVLSSLSWALKQQEHSLVRDSQAANSTQKEDFSALKGQAEAPPAQQPAAPQPQAQPQPQAGPSASFDEALALLATPNYEQGVALLHQLAQAGDADAQYKLSSLYQSGNRVQKNMSDAFYWCLLAARQGNANAQADVANMYATGDGVLKDERQAAEWYQQAANQGLASAQYNLYGIYAYGRGVPKDSSLAFHWLEQAALAGDLNAQFSLGFSYAEGDLNLTQDHKKAAFWYQKAADSGNPAAWCNLGCLYEYGEGVPQNYAKAAEYYQKAADAGIQLAMANLANLYRDGNGVAEDPVKALELYRKAVNKSDNYAYQIKTLQEKVQLMAPKKQLEQDRKKLILICLAIPLAALWLFNPLKTYLSTGSFLPLIPQLAVVFFTPFVVTQIYASRKKMFLLPPPPSSLVYIGILLVVSLIGGVVIFSKFGRERYDEAVFYFTLLVRGVASLLVLFAALNLKNMEPYLPDSFLKKQ